MSTSEKNTAKDKSGNRKYFTMVLRIVRLKARTPYDISAWLTVMDIAGENGECDYNTDDLAALSCMSTGKFSECRSYLIEQGLLEGRLESTDGGQAKWHLTVPDLWEENVRLAQQCNTIENRIKYNKEYVLNAIKKPSSHEGKKPSLSESKPSPHEGKPSPHENTSFIEKTSLEEPLRRAGQKEKNRFEDLLEFWNSLNIYNHGAIPPKDRGVSFVDAVSARLLEADGLFEYARWNRIETTMQNYADVYHSAEHSFKFRWTVTEFLQRGFDKFVDREICMANFRKANFTKEQARNSYDRTADVAANVMEAVLMERRASA